MWQEKASVLRCEGLKGENGKWSGKHVLPDSKSDKTPHFSDEGKLIVGLILFLVLDPGHSLLYRHGQRIAPERTGFLVRKDLRLLIQP